MACKQLKLICLKKNRALVLYQRGPMPTAALAAMVAADLWVGQPSTAEPMLLLLCKQGMQEAFYLLRCTTCIREAAHLCLLNAWGVLFCTSPSSAVAEATAEAQPRSSSERIKMMYLQLQFRGACVLALFEPLTERPSPTHSQPSAP